MGEADLTDLDWEALVARRQTGQFYGVRTTGIFCRFGCPSRLPLRRNVTVFTTCETAEANGFRACKRCTPDVRKVQ